MAMLVGNAPQPVLLENYDARANYIFKSFNVRNLHLYWHVINLKNDAVYLQNDSELKESITVSKAEHFLITC